MQSLRIPRGRAALAVPLVHTDCADAPLPARKRGGNAGKGTRAGKKVPGKLHCALYTQWDRSGRQQAALAEAFCDFQNAEKRLALCQGDSRALSNSHLRLRMRYGRPPCDGYCKCAADTRAMANLLFVSDAMKVCLPALLLS